MLSKLALRARRYLAASRALARSGADFHLHPRLVSLSGHPELPSALPRLLSIGGLAFDSIPDPDATVASLNMLSFDGGRFLLSRVHSREDLT